MESRSRANDKPGTGAEIVHDFVDIFRVQLKILQRCLQNYRHLVELRLVDLKMRMQPLQGLVGIGHWPAHDRGNEFRLMINQLAHFDIFEMMADDVGIEGLIVKRHDDFTDVGETAITLEHGLRHVIFPTLSAEFPGGI